MDSEAFCRVFPFAGFIKKRSDMATIFIVPLFFQLGFVLQNVLGRTTLPPRPRPCRLSTPGHHLHCPPPSPPKAAEGLTCETS